jgi:hypothetical protein
LHPPTGARKSWFAYWQGLVSSRSTGQRDYAEAVKVVQDMLNNGGNRSELQDAVLSDQEFEQIQREHYGRKQDPAANARAAKSLFSCMNAITAFRAISGLKPVTIATPDACAAFQRKALGLPKNWRLSYPKSKPGGKTVSPNTVLKWSRALQAAFERANKNAGRKCVRGVVPEPKLLSVNPWNQIPWIEGRERPLRQFDAPELLAILDYFAAEWPGVSVASSVA